MAMAVKTRSKVKVTYVFIGCDDGLYTYRMVERWRWVKGFENLYMISSLGRIKSFKQDPAGRLMKPSYTTDGYQQVGLRDGSGLSKSCRVHCLVAEAFLLHKKKKNHKHVCHNDNVRDHNWVQNLRYDTVQGNACDRVEARSNAGENNSRAVVNAAIVLQIRELAEHLSYQALADRFHIGKSTVADIVKGYKWCHVAGKRWRGPVWNRYPA